MADSQSEYAELQVSEGETELTREASRGVP